jgi:spermidine synthase
MATATYVAAAINGVVVLIAFTVAKKAQYETAPSCGSPREEAEFEESQITNRKSQISRLWPVYIAIALSGMTALGAEVIWTRLLSLMLGGTVYTFSIILAVFLVGLGLGSSVGSLMSRGSIQPRFALGCCQLLLSAAMAWTAYMIAKSLPYWPINPSLSKSPWFNFQIDLLRCAWAILPRRFCGAQVFRWHSAAAQSPGVDPGRLVGKVYAANTLGAIVGALVSSLFLVSWIGTATRPAGADRHFHIGRAIDARTVCFAISQQPT